MAKKRKQPVRPVKKENASLTLSDSLGDDILEKLKAAKKELSDVAKIKAEAVEKERVMQIRKEREEREKNKSFEELLNEYGDTVDKY
ncbi:YqkE family protein [Sporosarcina sp. FA9]|uniref:YqkE family protein n=1 Tax=Sporosarcina sp. FA9 TaxID=3413030 RepID=UPI003F6586EF